MIETAIDITHIPFSRYGAYVSVTRDYDKDGSPAKALTIHSVRKRFEEGPMFSLSFGKDGDDDFTCSARPEAAAVENGNGRAVIYIRNDDTIVIDSRGLDLRLKYLHYCWPIQTSENSFRMMSGSYHFRYLVDKGRASMEGPAREGDRRSMELSVSCDDGRVVMAMSMRPKEPREIETPINPDKEIAGIRSEWEDFLAQMPETGNSDGESPEFRRLTWYNIWSCFVRAEDVYVHDTVLMAKKKMTSTWSWDHCFNALSLARMKDEGLAFEYALNQFMAPFHLQAEQGILPDLWNPGLETYWGTTKPPIHGWCFSKLMDHFEFSREELETVYSHLEKWTGWWTDHSDTDFDGIPDYPRGCDSGWDNSTLFDIGFYLESPDLPAYLVLQMRTLARIAGKLGEEDKKRYWLGRSQEMLDRLISHSWNGERFVAKLSGSHKYEENPTSLLAVMPIVLGDILPDNIFSALADILEKNFLTDNGPATEMPASPKYNPNGYWRGPVWAPTTYLIVDGLRRGGREALAGTIAERYCRMSREKAKGNYENFDALTGKGLCAPGYTWSASVYMLLSLEYGC